MRRRGRSATATSVTPKAGSLGLDGTLELFTIIYLAIDGLAEPPYVLAYVRPNGADTALPGFVEGLDLSTPARALEQLAIGSRVVIVLREKRIGRITDVFFRLSV